MYADIARAVGARHVLRPLQQGPGQVRPRTPRAALLLAVTAVVTAALVPLSDVAAQSVPELAGAPPGNVPNVLTLPAVLRSALDRHPLIEAAAARVRGAQGARRTAGALPNPIVTYQVENAALPGGARPIGLAQETSTFATLPLEPLWQRGPRVQRANADVRASEAELAVARRAVALDAARAYYRIALAQIAVQGAAEVQEGLDSLLRFNRTRVAEGATAEGDLIRLEVERDRNATERAIQDVELIRARAALVPFLNDTLSGSVALPATVSEGIMPGLPHFAVAVDNDATMAAQNLVLPDRSVFVTRALIARPDVLASRARARASGAELALQRTLFVRQLGATFGTKRTAGVSSMIAGLSLPIPLFDQNRGEVERATGERGAAEQELTWTERRATAEVAGAYEGAQALAAQLAPLRGRLIERAEESRRIALAAYREGAAPLFQVIDATRTLADARLTYYRAMFAQREGLLELYAAAGFDPLDAATGQFPSLSLGTAPTTATTPTGSAIATPTQIRQ